MDINDEVRFRVSPEVEQFNRPSAERGESRAEATTQAAARVLMKKSSSKPPPHKNIPTSVRQRTRTRQNLQAVVNSDGLIEVDLSSKSLREVPANVLDLGRLESLLLSHNEIKVISKSIGRLYRLRVFVANNNSLYGLPETFTNLRHLQRLDLSHNKLHSLPTHFGSLKALTSLKLAHNLFETLPHCGGDLKSLRFLDLSGNKLWHVPSSFIRLASLRQLSLAENSFDQLPLAVCRLTQLEALDLHGNNLVSLPAEFSQLAKLKELNIARNKLAFVPPCILSLKQLRAVDVSQNQLAQLPPSLRHLEKLRILSAHTNKLLDLPAGLSSLEYLHLGQNRLTNFSVVKLKKLTYLNACRNRLENIPLGVYNLAKIQVLKLANNSISYLSQDVILLQELKHLDLSFNKLKSLPQVINDLEKLEIFNVKGNPLVERKLVQHGFPPSNTKSNQGQLGEGRIAYKSEPNLSALGMKPKNQVAYPYQHLTEYPSGAMLHNSQQQKQQQLFYQHPYSLPLHSGALQNGVLYAPLSFHGYEKESTLKKKLKKSRSWFWSRKKGKKNSVDYSNMNWTNHVSAEGNYGHHGYGSAPETGWRLAADPRHFPPAQQMQQRPLQMKYAENGRLVNTTPVAIEMPSGSSRYAVSRRRRQPYSPEGAPTALAPVTLEKLSLRDQPKFDPLETLRVKQQQRQVNGLHGNSPLYSNGEVLVNGGSSGDAGAAVAMHSNGATNWVPEEWSSGNTNNKPRRYVSKNFLRNTSSGTLRSLRSLAAEPPAPAPGGYSDERVPDGTGWLEPLRRHRSVSADSLEARTPPGSSTGATVMGTRASSVGDGLSLGSEIDHAYQPTNVSDQKLSGLLSDVESLLNDQLVQQPAGGAGGVAEETGSGAAQDRQAHAQREEQGRRLFTRRWPLVWTSS